MRSMLGGWLRAAIGVAGRWDSAAQWLLTDALPFRPAAAVLPPAESSPAMLLAAAAAADRRTATRFGRTFGAGAVLAGYRRVSRVAFARLLRAGRGAARRARRPALERS